MARVAARRHPGRSFALVVLAVCAVAIGVLLLEAAGYKQNRKRNVSLLNNTQDLECRLVHKYKNKCKFVNENCPDEEAGVISYLSLFYCRLPNAQPLAFVIVTLWLGLLFMTIGIAASEFFCINLSTIARILGMSESLAGVTFLAFGNGSPDVFSTFAAMNSNSGSLAIGELIGAAGFISAVVAGAMAIVRPFRVARRSFVRDLVFFILSICFAFGFLADGHLYLWECVVMVVLYVFYVIFVVTWHWWLQRRRLRRETEARARTHFIVTGADDEDAHLLPDDLDDDVRGVGSRTNSGFSEDFGALERAQRSPAISAREEEEDEEEEQERGLASLSRKMRVQRRQTDRSSIAPIRPSLVGALEFRAVLSSLQNSGNNKTRPISLRRYSDDPGFMIPPALPQVDGAFDISATEARQLAADPDVHNLDGLPVGKRVRSVSVNDAAQVAWNAIKGQPEVVPKIGLQPSSPPVEGRTMQPSDLLFSRVDSMDRARSPDLLSPFSSRATPISPSNALPKLKTTPSARPRKLTWSAESIQEETPLSPYRDSPNGTPRGTSPAQQQHVESPDTRDIWLSQHRHQLKAWPAFIIPSGELIWATLFPTLYGWKRKSWWERILGVVAAPSVFLLTVTLPVVELDDDDYDEVPSSAVVTPHRPSSARTRSLAPLPSDSPEFVRQEADYFNDVPMPEPSVGLPASDFDFEPRSSSVQPQTAVSPSTLVPQPRPDIGPLYSHKDWNRWLLAVQSITAPLFIVFMVWANTSAEDGARSLLRPILFALLGGLVTLGILLTFTSAEKPPKWRFLFCFAGFVVSIAWISAVANEVVGVLKTLGVVLGISDAILGLTIFAVGNSLGDLVADITVSRLGYPVMALSACFGGPMLNILLGIGISGMYMTLHQKAGPKAPYEIEVSHSLTISAASLLFTLVAHLVVVPLNKWRMDRRIGWFLVGIWAVSTVINVVLEIVGWGRAREAFAAYMR